ncbi:hypothetical protein [Stenotrophomonas rhizophila]|uniref:hypothetical protein n=1 Tax=Stenotrophomonas rhizophila TaxID=216778 RepID=UPI0028A7F3A2|nr:hypothetical protein [Stenotrophomonas rhizophila]
MSNIRMNLVMSEQLKKELDSLDEGNASETMRKALTLYVEAKKRTRDGKTKLGFFDGASRQVEGEIIGL